MAFVLLHTIGASQTKKQFEVELFKPSSSLPYRASMRSDSVCIRPSTGRKKKRPGTLKVQVFHKIASGGSKIVYDGEDEESNRVAVSFAAEFDSSFVLETNINVLLQQSFCSSFQPPCNFLRLLGCRLEQQEKNGCIVAMERAADHSLEQVKGALSRAHNTRRGRELAVRKIFQQLLEAVRDMHSVGIAWMDAKEPNILFAYGSDVVGSKALFWQQRTPTWAEVQTGGSGVVIGPAPSDHNLEPGTVKLVPAPAGLSAPL